MLAVYTVLIGNYDSLFPVPDRFRKSADYFLFSDRDISVDGWTTIVINRKNDNPRRDSRRPKIRPRVFLPDYYTTLYIDAAIELLVDPIEITRRYTGDLTVLKHPYRDCIYDEALACHVIGHIDKTQYGRLMNFLHVNGYPHHIGLTENGVILRRNTDRVLRLCNYWQQIYDQYTQRDQLSFCFCCWKLGIPYDVFQTKVRHEDGYVPTEFKLNQHL